MNNFTSVDLDMFCNCYGCIAIAREEDSLCASPDEQGVTKTRHSGIDLSQMKDAQLIEIMNKFVLFPYLRFKRALWTLI